MNFGDIPSVTTVEKGITYKGNVCYGRGTMAHIPEGQNMREEALGEVDVIFHRDLQEEEK